MFPRIHHCLATLALGTVSLLAHAHDGPLDHFFGDGGMRNYGFQSYNGSGRNDKAAAVACPGPGGTLVVTGEASDATRLVTMRLMPNGDYDTRYGAGGRVSVEFAMTQEPYSAGLCLPDSKVLLARRVRIGATGEMSVQLVRIDATTGRLDTRFGQGGATFLDLDSWQDGLQQVEAPLALTALDGGDVLLTGHVGMADRFVAFAARVRDDGHVPVARVYVDAPQRATANTIMTAVLASDGHIWGVIEGRQPGSTRVTPFRVRLDRMTLAWLDVPDPLPNTEGNHIYGGRGVRVRENVLAVPMIQRIAGSLPWRYSPGIMIYRAEGKIYLPLPEPAVAGEVQTISDAFAVQSALALPGGRVLVAFATKRPGENTSRGMHLAMVQVGATIGSDALDKTFGVGGAQTAVFRPVGSGCPMTTVAQDFSGLAYWNGAPTLVGNVDSSCNNNGGGVDYLVARLQADRVFDSASE
ncbi:hypothetical protein [Tahibacter sp.]|uniref:hypothetical protein n=1 Tax=Tahibacter sp. TaxID=2056211 RepID=UPI0028C391BE|nr:hypothetical protein [Tahibacter sp.]